MPKTQSKVLAVIKAVIAVSIWGATFVATKIALRDVSPPTVVWLRFGIGVLVISARLVTSRFSMKTNVRDLGYFALLGLIGITTHQLLQSTGLMTSSAATTAWIVASTPIFMALLGWLFLREKIFNLQVLGILSAAAGVITVISQGNFSRLSLGNFGAPGDALIMLSAPNWAVFSTLSRYGLKKYSPTVMLFFVMTFGWLSSSVVFFWQSDLSQISNLSSDSWLAIAFLGIFGSGVAYIFWYDALQTLTTAQTGAFLYLEPFVTVIVAMLFLSEPFRWVSIGGGLSILFGVWMVNNPKGGRIRTEVTGRKKSS